MVIKTVYHFLNSNLEVEISSKKRLAEKEGGVLEVPLPGKGKIWEGRICLGDQE